MFDVPEAGTDVAENHLNEHGVHQQHQKSWNGLQCNERELVPVQEEYSQRDNHVDGKDEERARDALVDIDGMRQRNTAYPGARDAEDGAAFSYVCKKKGKDREIYCDINGEVLMCEVRKVTKKQGDGGWCY